jgi:hypothetical protein
MLTKSTETERTQGKNIGKYNHKGEKNKNKKKNVSFSRSVWE